MNTFQNLLCVLSASLLSSIATAADARLNIPDFSALEEKASESVSITLDPALLGMAVRFLDPGDPKDAAAREAIKGITGIYVKSFTFESDFAYPQADVDRVRKQLSGKGWQRLVEVRSRKEQANVDIYISVDADRANGLAIIASEPREFTIVNIVGSIDMRKLHDLEGQFGLPKLQLEKDKEPKTK